VQRWCGGTRNSGKSCQHEAAVTRGGLGALSSSPPPAPSRPPFIDAPEQASHAGPLEAEDNTVPLSPPTQLTPPPSVLSVDAIMDDTELNEYNRFKRTQNRNLVYGVYIIYLYLSRSLSRSLSLSLSLSLYLSLSLSLSLSPSLFTVIQRMLLSGSA